MSVKEKNVECFGIKYRMRADWGVEGSPIQDFDFDTSEWNNLLDYAVGENMPADIFRDWILQDCKGAIDNTLSLAGL